MSRLMCVTLWNIIISFTNNYSTAERRGEETRGDERRGEEKRVKEEKESKERRGDERGEK